MVKTAGNIWVGAPATVVVSAYGVVEGSGVDLGSTEGGVQVAHATELFYKQADQWIGKVGAVMVDKDITITMTLAECTLANLAYAFSLPTTAVAGTILSLSGADTLPERTLYITAKAPTGGTSKWTFHKVVIEGASEVGMVKADKSMVQVTFKVLQDTSKTEAEQFGTVEFSGVDTTPPTVAMTTPVTGGTVAHTTRDTVTLTFTEAHNQMDEGTLVYGSTILINNVTTPGLVAGVISYNATTKVLTFTPAVNWTTAENMQVVVTTAVRDTAGNHLATAFVGQFSVT
jgi:hypothetical protein